MNVWVSESAPSASACSGSRAEPVASGTGHDAVWSDAACFPSDDPPGRQMQDGHFTRDGDGETTTCAHT